MVWCHDMCGLALSQAVLARLALQSCVMLDMCLLIHLFKNLIIFRGWSEQLTCYMPSTLFIFILHEPMLSHRMCGSSHVMRNEVLGYKINSAY